MKVVNVHHINRKDSFRSANRKTVRKPQSRNVLGSASIKQMSLMKIASYTGAQKFVLALRK